MRDLIVLMQNTRPFLAQTAQVVKNTSLKLREYVMSGEKTCNQNKKNCHVIFTYVYANIGATGDDPVSTSF
jgi:hypothetical protein